MAESFLFDLESLLVTVNELNRSDLETAIGMLKTKMYACSLKHNGPCLWCRKLKIEYSISHAHKTGKDKWLAKLFREWNEPIYLSICEGSRNRWTRKINGFNINSVFGYFCEDCKKQVQQEFDVLGEEHEKKLADAQIQREEEEALRPLRIKQIISGEIESRITTRYWTLFNYMTPNRSSRLRSLPYEKFLKSSYWDIVRRYKLYRSKFRCSLCNCKGVLHVHHKTYENHGAEHLHLDDLITLCKICHEKFHSVETKGLKNG